MENMHKKVVALAMAMMILVGMVEGQSSSSVCTGPMMRSFNSCIGFLAGGSNASSPTKACCNSLRDLMSNGQDCLCLIITGGVPFQVPINRSLAISLPKACRQSGVPVECKATASPLPAPGPRSSDGPSTNPGLSPPSIFPGFTPPSPRSTPFIPQPFSPPSPPQRDGGSLVPPQMPPQGDVIPTLTPPGMRPTLTSSPACRLPQEAALPSLLLSAIMGVIMLIC